MNTSNVGGRSITWDELVQRVRREGVTKTTMGEFKAALPNVFHGSPGHPAWNELEKCLRDDHIAVLSHAPKDLWRVRGHRGVLLYDKREREGNLAKLSRLLDDLCNIRVAVREREPLPQRDWPGVLRLAKAAQHLSSLPE